MDDWKRELTGRVEAIVAEARDVRERVRAAVVAALETAGAGADRMAEVSREVLAAAERGAESATSDESALRDVVDGLADAFEVAAQASRLAFEEAASEGKAFVDEDVKKLDEDLQSLGRSFVGLVEKGGPRLVEHAERAFGRVRESAEVALRAARNHPREVAQSAARAGVEAGRQATGALFTAIGRLMQAAGDRIARADDDGENAG